MSLRARILLIPWVAFVALVAFGIHGSSSGVTARWWAPEMRYRGSLLEGLRPDLAGPPSLRDRAVDASLMVTPREIRWDEFVLFTPFALSQLNHDPPFPVVNTSIALGQNMLVLPHVPVAHPLSVARPATWGYFFLGAQRGLAWFWWFPVFACFTVLFLLLEIVLCGRPALAAFGAWWFCASAYVVCWSLWPAHVTFFAMLACLSAYHLIASASRVTQAASAALLGLSLPGFAMILYPPWQVPLGYFALLLFTALCIRDRLHRRLVGIARFRVLAICCALTLAGVLVGLFVWTCAPEFRTMADTAYPGRRLSVGGDFSFAELFKGMYNGLTIYQAPSGLKNESESASFFYLFPAVLIGACLSKPLVSRLGWIGGLLLTWVLAGSFYLLVGVPRGLAVATFLRFVPSHRADLTIGLASIMLCMYVASMTGGANGSRESPVTPLAGQLSALGTAVFFLFHGITIRGLTADAVSFAVVGCVAIGAGAAAWLLLSGRIRRFCALVGCAVVATTAWFNPLSTNLDHLLESELAQQIRAIEDRSPDRPLWLCYGGIHPGVLVSLLGSRSLSGNHFSPRLALWRAIDPQGSEENKYNRFAEVSLTFPDDETQVAFGGNYEDSQLEVAIAPTHPLLRELGAGYVLALGDAQVQAGRLPLRTVYKSPRGTFSIFAIDGADEERSAYGLRGSGR